MIHHTDEQLLAIPTAEGRVRVLLLEILINRMSGDPTPATVAQAVYGIRQRSGINNAQLAGRVLVSRAAISTLESGHSQGSPSVLRRIADEAERQHMTNTARWLRKHADATEYENTKRGGKK